VTVILSGGSGNMGLFEDYPDYAMMTNDQGERDTKPWVSGQSPLAMGLMSAGLGILAAPDVTSEWVGGGGGGESLGRGGLLGLQAFQQGHQDLQGQRKDFYTHLNAQEDQVIQNMQAKRQEEEYQRLQQGREKRDESFPGLLQMLRSSGRQEYMDAVPMLKQLYLTSPEKAVAASMNIVSQLKKAPGAVKTTPIIDAEGNPTGHSYITQNGEYKTTVKTGSNSIGDLNLDTKRLKGILFNGSQPDSKMTPANYRKYYKMLQQDKLAKGVIKDGERQKLGMFAGPLESFQSPWEFGKSKGLSEAAMTKMGWKKDPSIKQWMEEGTGLPGTEQSKSAFKFGQIAQTEDDIVAIAKEYPNFDHTETAKPSADAWMQYAMKGSAFNPFTGPARSAESAYMGGAQGFAYLFSGATVRAEELHQFRMIMYPVPGDSQFDVKRKAARRERIMDLYNSVSPDSMKQAYNVANQASRDEGEGELKMGLERKEKVTGNNKKEVEETLTW
tara:strand:- start:57 stop:1553 length:1497 start_codon:yes stop_codon:yes gene_type:complete